MDAGFRRSGNFIYQPMCRGCRACVPLRVPVETFRPSKSQRRCSRLNRDLTVTAGAPAATDENYALYARYIQGWHGRPDEGREQFKSFLYNSPVESVEFSYRDPAGRLIAVGICDVCDSSLSSVYFYFDPADARRSLGTFGALHEIEVARRLGVPNYYLGYWIAGCGNMHYKTAYQPCEVLRTDGTWAPFEP